MIITNPKSLTHSIKLTSNTYAKAIKGKFQILIASIYSNLFIFTFLRKAEGKHFLAYCMHILLKCIKKKRFSIKTNNEHNNLKICNIFY